MESNNLLFVHIGTGKTGTSAIQQTLELNEDKLREAYNLNYLKTGRYDAKHRSLDFNARRNKANYTEIVCDQLRLAKEEILNSQCTQHLISDEDFPGISREEIQQLYDIFAPEVRVKLIVYLRRQDEYVESWYGQIVKTGAYTADIDNLYKRLASGNLLDYPLLLSPWMEVFGENNIIVRPYEPAQFCNSDLIDDFLTAMNIVASDLVRPAKEINTSLSRDKILLLRKMARNQLEGLIDSAFIERLKTIETPGDSKFVMSPAKRLEILQSYELGNNKISEKFLSKPRLFCAPPPDASNWVSRSEVPDKLFLAMYQYLAQSCAS